jgi:polysaccharide biosynthesis transport protein
VDLRGQLAVIRARGALIVGCVVLAVLAAIAVSLVSPKVYQSSATLIVGQSLTTANPDIGQIETSQRLSETYAQIATTRPILDSVIAKLHLATTADELRKQVTVVAAQDTTLLTIAVEQPDPAQAAAIANELGAQLIDASPAVGGEQSDVQAFVLAEIRRLQGEIEVAQAETDALDALETRTPEQERRRSELASRLISLRSAYATLHSQVSSAVANRITVVEPAVAAATPTSPRLPVNVLLAILVGGLIGIAAAFLFEYLDDSVKASDDATRATGLPVLGVVPRMRDTAQGHPMYLLATLVYPRSGAAESFRVLRTNLEFAGIDAPLRIIVVTSALPREGKTIIASNLAVAYAQAGRRTLLVDADLRRPGVHSLFRVTQSPGLTELLRSEDLHVAEAIRPTGDTNLHVMPSGTLPPNPAELLGSARMERALKRIADAVDVIVIDTPPVNVVADAAILAKLADGTILVVDSGRTRREAARAARDALGRVGARMLGLTLNRGRDAADTSFGYYGVGGPMSGEEAVRSAPLRVPTEEPG